MSVTYSDECVRCGGETDQVLPEQVTGRGVPTPVCDRCLMVMSRNHLYGQAVRGNL